MSGSDGVSDADDAVLYEATDSGVAILTFNRADRLNAWGPDIAAGFYAGIDRAEQLLRAHGEGVLEAIDRVAYKRPRTDG